MSLLHVTAATRRAGAGARWPDCATGWHDRCTQRTRCGCPCHAKVSPKSGNQAGEEVAMSGILREALQLINRNGCENLTRGRCSGDPGRTRDSQYTSTQWCPPCIAADALDPTS